MAFEETESDQLALERLGHRLRQLREARAMSLRAAAAASGLSASFIGMIERGESMIAFTRLMRLADAYGVTVGDLVEGLEEKAPPSLHSTGTELRPVKDESGLETFYIPAPPGFVQPFRSLVPPGTETADFVHPTAEFLHCVEGSLTIVLDGEPIAVKSAETIFVPKGMPHAYVHQGTEPAAFVGAVERPSGGVQSPL